MLNFFIDTYTGTSCLFKVSIGRKIHVAALFDFCKSINIFYTIIYYVERCLFQTKSTLTVITAKWYKSTDTLMSQQTKKGGK